MNLEFVALIVLFNYLRKNLQSKSLLPEWDKLLLFGNYLSIALIVIEVTVSKSRPVTAWLAHLLFFSVIYLLLSVKAFQQVKSVVYAIAPFVIVNFLDDVIKLVAPAFHQTWNNYFDTAKTFAIIWFIALLIINNKQRKALEKEKLKAVEKEKEFKITQSLKDELEIQVAERTAELVGQKDELQKTINELKATQTQLIQAEKMASLGELTAGIAHEIQNPLNFVNNFSEVNMELIEELKTEMRSLATLEMTDNKIEITEQLIDDIKANSEKINHHGKRAGDIVKGMLQHSRSSNGVKEPTDINVLCDEYLRLSYHGLRAKDKTFNATMKTDFDTSIGNINIIPQDIGRVMLNLFTNAFYVVHEKKTLRQAQGDSQFEPTVSISTKKVDGKVEIRVSDNGNGIPQNIVDKIFQPFFTTKPTGQGTGLGLSLSFDIVTKGHGGELKVETNEGEGSTFIVQLPLV